MRRWLLLVAVLLGGVACGDRAVGDQKCQAICLSVRDQLINSFGIPPADVNCSDAKWLDASTCAECTAILKDDYDVQPTDLCDGWD